MLFESYGDGPSLAQVQAAGFPMGGETLAIDLADTLVTASEPAFDIIADQDASDRFWRVHDGWLPEGWVPPAVAETRRIRDAIRRLLDGARELAPLDPGAVAIVNAASEMAFTTVRLVTEGSDARRLLRWRAENSGALAGAAAARSAIDLLADPSALGQLRRCASPTCSMLFVKGDVRRKWCTPNICSNRDRAARHYRRRRTG